MIIHFHRIRFAHSSLRKIRIALSIYLLFQLFFLAKSEGSIEPFQPNPVAAQSTRGIKNTGIEIDFIGAKSFTPVALRTALVEPIQEITQGGLTAATADDTAFFLGIFYRNNGFPDVDVKWAITSKGGLTLTISEGQETELGKIIFIGNSKISSKTLTDYVVGSTRERFPRQRKNLPFVLSDIQTGVERIHSLYETQGFLDVIVDPAQFLIVAGKADISITVHEGLQYHFGTLNITGDLVFRKFEKNAEKSEDPQIALLKMLEPFSKKPYTPETLSNMQREIVYFYRTRGYYDVQVEAKSDPAKEGMIPVTFKITTGNIYRFGEVQESGLDRLQPGFLKKRFAKLNGKFYNPEKLDDLYRSLMRTGLFKSLRITSKPLPSNEIELVMDAEEAKSKEIGFLLGYGTYEGFIAGFQAAERDLFGTGRSVTSTTELSQRILKWDVEYLDPWLWDSDYSFRFKIDALNQNLDGYTKVETGGRLELARAITKHLNVSVFLLPSDVQLNSISINPISDVGPTRYFVNSFGTTLTLDFRDSVINPGKGFIFTTTSDYAGSQLGSDLDFVRATGRLSYYLPIHQAILAFGARGGVISPLHAESSLPIDERFFNGGSRSVRSFAEQELGPKDLSNHPIGGDTFTTFNTELDFPLIGSLIGATFVDAGSVGHTLGSGFGSMRYGIGAGLRYKLPVGPVRIDYGFNPDPRSGEKQGAFHLSFGFAF